jgi:multidrug efflux pump subunit AcrA (membrane-fusion protein)
VRPRALVVSGGVVAILIAAVTALAFGQSGEGAAAAETEATVSTAKVARRDLVVRESLDGTLGYDDVRVLTAASAGTVTRLPKQGSVVRRGGTLVEIDGRALRLLYGEQPFWRRLGAGIADGRDVEQLERNLVELGYDPGTVNGHFDASTGSALRAWQDDIGAVEDGALDPGEAVFLPGPRRVGALKAVLGGPAQPGVELLDTSSTAPVVTVDLDARRRTIVAAGDGVQVELPSGRTVAGSIRDVGSVAEVSVDDAAEGATDPTVEVTITLRDAEARGGLDGAPVTVSVESERTRAALAVPVEALLALRGGGFALELSENGARRLVAVETGTFADGWVEVRGRGLRAGTTVVVPA